MKILFYGTKNYDEQFFEKLLPEFPDIKIKFTLPFEIAIFLKRTYYNLCFAVIIQFSRYVLVMSLKEIGRASCRERV